MAKGNMDLVQEYFPEHSRMGTARMKYDKETEEKGKKRGVSMERSKVGTKDGTDIERKLYLWSN